MADDIISEVQAPEALVETIQKEMTNQAAAGAQPGVPIDRIPYNEQLVNLEKSGVYAKAIAGTDRCIRLVTVPQKGGESAQYHCSRPCIGVGNQRLCPEHDKSFFQPNQTPHGSRPRITNASQIPLSSGEAEQMAQISKSFADPVPKPVITMLERTAPVAPVSAGRVTISFTLEELASGSVVNIFQERACEALDSLPCANLKQMKQMAAIQDKLAKIARRKAND